MSEDRESHRAAVEAGYADLREYVEAWEKSVDPAEERLAELISNNEELKKQIQDLKQYYYQFHQDTLNFLLKKDLISSFMKYRKKRKRDAGIFLED